MGPAVNDRIHRPPNEGGTANQLSFGKRINAAARPCGSAMVMTTEASSFLSIVDLIGLWPGLAGQCRRFQAFSSSVGREQNPGAQIRMSGLMVTRANRLGEIPIFESNSSTKREQSQVNSSGNQQKRLPNTIGCRSVPGIVLSEYLQQPPARPWMRFSTWGLLESKKWGLRDWRELIGEERVGTPKIWGGWQGIAAVVENW